MRQSCELCGGPEAKFFARVAGMESNVCAKCANLGEIIEEVQETPKPSVIRREEKKRQTIIERNEEVVEDIGEMVRQKREELGLKQEQLGKLVNEPESLIKRIEHGFIPRLKTAHKLEKALKLNLTEFVSSEEQEYSSGKTGGGMTLGDAMIIKKK
jgi:putative transcription factor